LKHKNSINELLIILIIFVISRMFIFCGFGLIDKVNSDLSYPVNAYIVKTPIVKDFVLYDSYHYSNIAKYGYNNLSNYPKIQNHYYIENMEACFFPLYSYVIRGFLWTGLTSETIGVILSNMCFVLFLYVLRKLLLIKNINSYLPLVALSLFPSSMFFSAMYTESLFLLLVICCFYFAEKRNWLLCGIFGLLGGLTRNTGILLSVFIFVQFIETYIKFGGKLKHIIYSVFPVIGLCIFVLMGYFNYGNGLLYIELQKRFGREFVNPFKFLTIDLFNGNLKDPLVFFNMFTCYVFVIITIVLLFDKKVNISYKIWTILLLGISMSTIYTGDDGVFYSLGYIRYCLPAIPVFMYIGKIKKYYSLPLILLWGGMLLVYSGMFYYKFLIA